MAGRCCAEIDASNRLCDVISQPSLIRRGLRHAYIIHKSTNLVINVLPSICFDQPKQRSYDEIVDCNYKATLIAKCVATSLNKSRAIFKRTTAYNSYDAAIWRKATRDLISKWRAKFGGMEASDARRLRELEAENAKLKHLLAEAHLDMHALKSVLGVKR